MTLDERLDRDLPLLIVLKRALARPLRMLAFHRIIQLTTVMSAVNYGLLYVVLSSFAEVVSSQYNLSIELTGLHYIAIALGELTGSQLGGQLMDILYRRTIRRHGNHEPEARLPLIYPGAALGSLGLIVFGWAAQYHVHWIVVDIGVFVFSSGLQISGMPISAYVIDVYADATSSALSANQFGRSLAAFLFPLFSPSLYKSLGYGWGNNTIAFVGAAAGLIPPFLLWRYGTRLRANTPAFD